MLKLTNLHAFYGKSHVLHGVDMQVNAGEIVALLGRNGSGRSTTAKSIMGLVECQGSVQWKDQQILGKKTYDCPSGHRVCAREPRHLSQTHGAPEPGHGAKQVKKEPALEFEDMYRMFPDSGARAYRSRCSFGGEQQMLTLCRTLMGDPDLIIIDEPTEGLAPKIVSWWVSTCWNCASAAFRFC